MDHLSALISKPAPAPESIAELEVIERQLLRVNTKIWNMIEGEPHPWPEPLAPIPAINRSIDKQTALQQKVGRLKEKVESVTGLLFLGGAIIPHEKREQENMLENLRIQAKTLIGELYSMQPPESRKELIDMEQELKFLDQLLHGKKPLEECYSAFRIFQLTELQSCVIELRNKIRQAMRIRNLEGDNENPILFSRVLSDEERALEWKIRNLQQKVADKLGNNEMPQSC